MVLIFAFTCGFIGYQVGQRPFSIKAVSGSAVKTGQDSEISTKMMNEVLTELKANYLHPEDIQSDKLMYGAAEGMTAALGDPYTSFFAPKENERSKQDLSGEFGGVGIELGFIDGTLAVMAPLKNTPAFKAGVQAGDLILNIKDTKKGIDKSTTDISISEAVEMIRGPIGDPVTLSMFREGDKQSREVEIVRDSINVPSTELSWVDNNQVAVMAVYKFGEQTKDEWNKMVDEVLAKKAKGVILDLRNNPGGYLQRAVDLGSEFIPSGVIVKQRSLTNTEELDASGRGRLYNMPLVVLINKGSASASEILSGALRERLGTKLVGVNSFGKGTVQTVLDLSDGAGLHITIAEWLLPNGTNIHKVGLTPDVEVKYEYDENNPDDDNQLDKALEVLKGLNVAKWRVSK